MTILGELVGFGLVGALAAALFRGEEPTPALLAAFSIVAALLEGSALAFAQWRVIRGALRVRYAQWAFGTIWPAASAYLVGMIAIPRLWDADLSLRALALVAGVILLGMGALLGVGQWLVLRPVATGTAAWVPASSIAWAGGVAVAVIGVSLSSDAPALGWTIAGSVLSGIAMGAFVGVATSFAYIRLRPRTTGGPTRR